MKAKIRSNAAILLTAIPLAFWIAPLFSQPFLTTRLEGVGTGTAFLEISETTRHNIVFGLFDGTIEYLPEHGPVQVEVYDANIFQPGEYQLELIDSDLSDSLLSDDIHWRLTKLATGEQAMSQFDVHTMPVQDVPAFGIRVKVFNVPAPGNLPPDNGAIGATIAYKNPNGVNWLEGIVDDYHPQRLNFVVSTPSNVHYTNLGNGYFLPYRLCHSDSDPASGGYGYLSPAWLDQSNMLINFNNDQIHEKLNNIDLTFTPDKSLWSRCVVVETATPDYYSPMAEGGLGLQTHNGIGLNCTEIGQFDLRGAPSVSLHDNDADGQPDPDGDGYGMGWFPGYAIDVETGQRLNVFFGENSAYSLDQDPSLLLQYGIDSSDFNLPPVGSDMLWNPSSQKMVDAGNVAGFPYQFYLGGQHFLYITNEPYDGCNYLRSRMSCEESALKKVNALKKITWTALPVLANGATLLPLADGLIPNEATVKLRVHHAFGAYLGTGLSTGHPTYRFELSPISQSKEANVTQRAVHLTPNPYSPQSGSPLLLNGLPSGCEVSVFSAKGELLGNLRTGAENGTDISQLFHPGTLGGIYFIRAAHPVYGVGTARLTVF